MEIEFFIILTNTATNLYVLPSTPFKSSLTIFACPHRKEPMKNTGKGGGHIRKKTKTQTLKVILWHLKSAAQISLQPEASCLCCRLFFLYVLQINIVPFGTIKISFETFLRGGT